MRRHAESKSKEHDWLLPIANVSRIMKKVLPKEAKLSKEAKEAVQECVSEFVSFITGEALERCHEEKRKTINGDDLLWALAIFGFDEYVKTLEVFLRKFREIEGGDKNPAGTASRRKDIGDGKDVGDGGRGGAGGGGVGNGGGLYDDAFMGMDEDIMALLEGFYGDY